MNDDNRPSTAAAALFEAALPTIESRSMREWAERNRSTWEKIAQQAIDRAAARRSSAPEPLWFATYITCVAMGAV